VRLLQHIWRDLRQGENIDLYPVIVISLLATVLSQLGIASQKLIFITVTCSGGVAHHRNAG
jgi:hypothetical protein